MQLIKNADLTNPNVCTICEEAPEGDFVLDTERFTPFNETYPLNGRKYVCQRCGTEIANKFGFVSSDAITQAQADADAARAELGNVRARTTELADHIRDFVSSPASVDPQASADALKAVFEQSDSPAKSAVEDSTVAVEISPAPVDATATVVDAASGEVIPADQVETRSYDEVFNGAAPVAATPAAEAKAADAGVNVADVSGTGINGKVTAPDVQAHIDSQGNAS